MPTTAVSQERIYLDAVPDLELNATTRASEPYDGDYDEPPRHFGLRLDVGAGASGFTQRGPGVATEDAFYGDAFGRVRFGINHDYRDFVQFRSDLNVLSFSSGDETLELTDRLTGRHRLRGMMAFGEETGVDLEIDYSLDHGGLQPLRQGRIDIGPAPFLDETWVMGIWLRSGNSEVSVTSPLRYHQRTVRYHGSGLPIEGHVTRGISSGLGMKFTMPEVYGAGWIKFVDVYWGHTEFIGANRRLLLCASRGLLETDSCPSDEAQAAAMKATETLNNSTFAEYPGSLERIQLDVLEIEDLIFDMGENVLVVINLGFGGAWLWDSQTDRELALFAFDAGFAFHIQDMVQVGMGATREPSTTPDGRRLVDNVRIESFLSIEPSELNAGFSFVVASNITSDHELYTEDEFGTKEYDTRNSVALHSRWFFAPTENFRLGLYHLADYNRNYTSTPNNWDPWAQQGDWVHELGTFARIDTF